MRKRGWLLLLAGTVAAALLMGCGQKGSSDTESAKDPQTEAAVDAQDEPQDAAAAEEETDTAGTGDTVDSEATDAASEEPAPNPAVETLLPISDAALQGVVIEDTSMDPVYDAEYNVAGPVFPGASAVWTVPEGTEGRFDIYLNISLSHYPYGETPFDVRINGADLQVWPMQILGASEEIGKDERIGTFLGAKDVTLAAGDQISVSGKYGLAFGNAASLIPDLSDLLLVPAGAEVAVGYGEDAAVPAKEETDPSDPFSGKTILWLGSSVTYGQSAGGYSMANAIDDAHPNVTTLKYAISGTTLVISPEKGPASYVERLEEIQTSVNPDLVVVQLSTNDATQGKPLGELSEGTKTGDFDTATIIGAEEEICAYAKETWGCPVVWYTGAYYENETSDNYQAMVDALLPVAEKWNCGIVDLWNTQEMKDLYDTEQYHAWMADGIHPNRDGYVEWWTPQFEPVLEEVLSR